MSIYLVHIKIVAATLVLGSVAYTLSWAAEIDPVLARKGAAELRAKLDRAVPQGWTLHLTEFASRPPSDWRGQVAGGWEVRIFWGSASQRIHRPYAELTPELPQTFLVHPNIGRLYYHTLDVTWREDVDDKNLPPRTTKRSHPDRVLCATPDYVLFLKNPGMNPGGDFGEHPAGKAKVAFEKAERKNICHRDSLVHVSEEIDNVANLAQLYPKAKAIYYVKKISGEIFHRIVTIR